MLVYHFHYKYNSEKAERKYLKYSYFYRQG